MYKCSRIHSDKTIHSKYENMGGEIDKPFERKLRIKAHRDINKGFR